MKISIKYLIVFSLMISSFYGCKKGSNPAPVVIPDTTKPTISIAKPTAGQIFTTGNTIPFQATFADNVNLKSYDISIAIVTTGGFILKNVPTSVPFSYTKPSTSLSSGSKSQDITLSDIAIPSNTATTIVTPGKYNFKVTCVDGSDNSASTTIEININ